MKQLNITFLLVILMNMAASKTFAHDIKVKNDDGVTIYYNFINDNTELAVTYLGTEYSQYSDEYSGNVVIPSSVTYNSKTYPVTSIGEGAFWDCSGLTSVTIPNSVTSIKNATFWGCSGLTSIEIPNSVTSIGEYAFYGCSGLTSIEIPNSVTSIGNYVFAGCSGLTSVEIPNSVTSIGGSAFSGCSSLTSVGIPNSVTSIGNYAFNNCTHLTSIVIPNSVTSIGTSPFSNCKNLASLTIGNGVTKIDKSMFSGCSGLTYLAVGNGLISMDNNVFADSEKLETLSLDCASIGTWFQNVSTLKNLVIGENVSSMADKAFSGCTKMMNVISKVSMVFNLPENAFSDLTFNNATLYIPEGTTNKYSRINYWTKFLFMEEGDGPILSGIKSVENDQTADGLGTGNWFTLDGRRLNSKPTKRGIYIVNGKKVVIK